MTEIDSRKTNRKFKLEKKYLIKQENKEVICFENLSKNR